MQKNSEVCGTVFERHTVLIDLAFEISKEKARQKLNEFSKLYTKPSDDPEVHPYHKYMLRGVCSLASTLYVLERTQPDDENDILSSEPTDWQWWKISFIGTDSKPVSRTVSPYLFCSGQRSQHALVRYLWNSLIVGFANHTIEESPGDRGVKSGKR